ncbi:MAG: glycosyltransferase [Conexivisphaerales archaeon]|nr:glycosyltransferase [Conexivisphaerales archaeon]
MRLGISTESLDPNFIGGGHEHAWRVIEYLKERHDLVYYPSLRTLTGPNAEQVLKEVESRGLEVPSSAFSLASRLSGVGTARRYSWLFLSHFKYLEVARDYASEPSDFYFDPNYYGIDVNFVASAAGKGYGLTVHGPYFGASLSGNVRNFLASARGSLLTPCAARALLTRVAYNNALRVTREKLSLPFRTGRLRFLAAVSRGTLEEHGLLDRGVRTVVLRPANAFDPSLLGHRTKDKQDYFVYYARLVFEKGLLHLPEVMRLVTEKRPEARLLLFGPQGKGYQGCALDLFRDKVRKYGLEHRVSYLGVLPRPEVHRVVSEARALLYPSFSDAFSLVLLEALALGTQAVAYAIPGVKSTFGELPDVRLVRPGDVEGMAEEALSLRGEVAEDQKTQAFLREHSDWGAVGRQLNSLIETTEFSKGKQSS